MKAKKTESGTRRTALRANAPLLVKKQTQKQKMRRHFKTAGIVAGGLLVCGMAATGMIVANWLQDAPQMDTSLLTEISQSSILYDRNGKQIATYSGYENREWVMLEDIPQWIKDGIVSTEDKRFFNHKGIDAKRFLGAIAGQIIGHDDYGGSTLTQQLVKNVYLTSEVTYKRKAQEIYLSLQLEKQMSKEEILEAYLNVIYLGGANYGVKAASRDFFGKELDELSLMECALIAGLTQNPNGYNPRLNQQKGDMTATKDRTETVLTCMKNNGKITQQEFDQAMTDLQNIKIAKETSHPDMYPYPHYVEYVLDEVARDILKTKGGFVSEEDVMYQKYAIRNGGYRIYTAFDPEAQKAMEQEAAAFDQYPKGEDGSTAQASGVLIDQTTGGIAAMIGSSKVPKAQETYNRATDSTQPIGSTMKPVAIYAAALEAGTGTGTPVADYPVGIPGYEAGSKYPGGVSTYAPMSMRKAIETSNNIPAAHFLCDYVGIETSANYLIQMGVKGSHISHTGSGIALGTSDVTTLEIAGAYATLANQGVYIEPHAYTSVVNSKSEEVLSAKNKPVRQVFSAATAWLMNDMLAGNVQHGGGTAANFDSAREIAGKSGTHEQNVITFGGYTAQYTLFLRIGCDSFSNMQGFVGGGTQTAALWNRIMGRIHEKADLLPLQKRSRQELGIEEILICPVSGKAAGASCEKLVKPVREFYPPGSADLGTCDMHVAVCQESRLYANESCQKDGTISVMTVVTADSYLGKVPSDMLEKSIKGYSGSTSSLGQCGINHTDRRLEAEQAAQLEAERQKEKEEEERRLKEEEERKKKEEEERRQQAALQTPAVDGQQGVVPDEVPSVDGQEGTVPAEPAP